MTKKDQQLLNEIIDNEVNFTEIEILKKRNWFKLEHQKNILCF